MAYPTSTILDSETYGVSVDRINAHFSDASQHGSGGGGGGAYDVEGFGISTANSGATNKANLLAATTANPDYVFHFGRGDYNLDNSGAGDGGITIDNQEGGFLFTGGSRLRFTTPTQTGIILQNTLAGFFIDGLSTIYSTLPTGRSNTYGTCGPLKIYGSDRIVLRNIKIHGSPGLAIYLSNAILPIIYNVQIDDAWADGVQIANSMTPTVVNLRAENLDDDGLAFLQTSTSTLEAKGGFAHNIWIENTSSSGVAIYGQDYSVITNVFVRNTLSAGLLVREGSFDAKPTKEVRFAHCHLENLGTYVKPGSALTYYNFGNGIRVEAEPGGTPPDCNLYFDDITIINPKGSGVEYYVEPGRLNLSNIRVKGGADTTADATGGSIQGRAPRAVMRNVEVNDIPGFGIGIHNSSNVDIQGAILRNTGKSDATKRALSISNFSGTLYATQTVTGSGIRVLDEQVAPTGFKLYSYADVGKQNRGHLGAVDFYFPNGTPGSALTQFGTTLTRLSSPNEANDVSADRGNPTSPLVLTMDDLPIQRFATALSANRAITLPTAGVYNGARFKIVRTGLGAFTLDVGGLKTIASATAAWVEVTHDGTAWRLTGYSPL